MRYKLVIFDVDGTMLDTSEGIIASAYYAMDVLELSRPDLSIMRTFIGPPIQDSFQRTIHLTEEKAGEAAAIFRERYKNIDLLRAKPYPGILELFKSLRNKKVLTAIATFKRQDYAEAIVRHFGFEKFTNIICGADFAGKLKKKDIISNAISFSNVNDKREVVMVGDTYLDAEGACSQGIDFIAVSYGFGFEPGTSAEACNAVGMADYPMEILKYIEG